MNEMSGPAKLPEDLRQSPERYLRDVAVGETALVLFTSMQHVTVPPDIHWKLGEFKTEGWYPVASITVAGDKWGGNG